MPSAVPGPGNRTADPAPPHLPIGGYSSHPILVQFQFALAAGLYGPQHHHRSCRPATRPRRPKEEEKNRAGGLRPPHPPLPPPPPPPRRGGPPPPARQK